MNAVGQILLDYDDDSEVPMYGFGAKPQFPNLKSSVVQHAFHLTGTENPNAYELPGMMEVYSHALKHVLLSGPTYFNPII